MASATRHRNDPITYVTNPTFNDVLLGRGAPYITFEGNKRFRLYVRTRKAEYTAAKRYQTKEAIARSVINEIQRRGGRFLERIKDRKVRDALGVADKATDVWALAPDDAVVEKCKQALRDKDPPIKNELARRNSPRRAATATTTAPIATITIAAEDRVSPSAKPEAAIPVAAQSLVPEQPAPVQCGSAVQPEVLTASFDASSTVQPPTIFACAPLIPNLPQMLLPAPPQPAPPWSMGPRFGSMMGQALLQPPSYASSQLAGHISQLLYTSQATTPMLDLQQSLMLQSYLSQLQQLQPSSHQLFSTTPATIPHVSSLPGALSSLPRVAEFTNGALNDADEDSLTSSGDSTPPK